MIDMVMGIDKSLMELLVGWGSGRFWTMAMAAFPCCLHGLLLGLV
jgi:hypothetical protein